MKFLEFILFKLIFRMDNLLKKHGATHTMGITYGSSCSGSAEIAAFQTQLCTLISLEHPPLKFRNISGHC